MKLQALDHLMIRDDITSLVAERLPLIGVNFFHLVDFVDQTNRCRIVEDCVALFFKVEYLEYLLFIITALIYLDLRLDS